MWPACHIESDHINFEWPWSSNKEAVGFPVVQTSMGWHRNKWTEAHFHETLRMQVDSHFKAGAGTYWLLTASQSTNPQWIWFCLQMHKSFMVHLADSA